MIDNKVKEIILKTYGLKLFPFDKQCFICKIFNQELGLATNAHSISKGNNLIGNVWYTFYHDKRNLDNKTHLTNKKTLIQVSPQSASVSLSICNKHDSRFHIFEQQNIVDMNNIEHLYLLKIRTMLYFYYIIENYLINLDNKKKFLAENKHYFKNKKHLILGAFGCGVFGGNPKTVAKLFNEKIKAGFFTGLITFAIMDAKIIDIFKKEINH